METTGLEWPVLWGPFVPYLSWPEVPFPSGQQTQRAQLFPLPPALWRWDSSRRAISCKALSRGPQSGMPSCLSFFLALPLCPLDACIGKTSLHLKWVCVKNQTHWFFQSQPAFWSSTADGLAEAQHLEICRRDHILLTHFYSDVLFSTGCTPGFLQVSEWTLCVYSPHPHLNSPHLPGRLSAVCVDPCSAWE